MTKDFFIMVNHPNGEIMAIVEKMGEFDDKTMMFETKEKARALAKDHEGCKAFGYEIFEKGDGSQ